jgi:hypothetical protein
MKLNYLAAALLLLPGALCVGQDLSAFDVKPGLWETTSNNSVFTGSMPAIPPEALARLPPQQRAALEARQSGKGTVRRSCVTREELKKPFPVGDNSCKRTLLSSGRNHQEIRFDCDHNGTKSTGTLKLDAPNSETFTGSMSISAVLAESTPGGGRPMDMKMTFSGKWIGSDCGDVKPASAQ